MKNYGLDLQGKLTLQNLVDDPATVDEGRIFFNLTEQTVKFQDSTGTLTIFHEGNIEEMIDMMNAAGLSLWEKVGDTYLLGTTSETVEIVGDLKVNRSIYYDEIYSNGNSGTSKNIDWTNGNRQSITMTGNCTFTFTNPPGPCSLMLSLLQDVTGSRTATWPASVRWVESLTPVLSTGANDLDIVGLYFDGNYYYSTISKNFG